MSREIKFRVWDKQLNQMFVNPFFTIPTSMRLQDAMQCMAADGWIWMQFTGLLDKNRTEIYEKDIVKFKWLGIEIIDYLEFVKLPFASGFQLNKIGSPPPSCDWQIIGNIYENPELLRDLE